MSDSKKALVSSKIPAALGPYSAAVEFGNMVFLSGQLPLDPATNTMPEGIAAQTAQSLNNIENLLKDNGLTLNDVVKTTVFLSDIENFAGMNEVYASRFSAPFPARSCVEVARIPKDALVEIECIAIKH